MKKMTITIFLIFLLGMVVSSYATEFLGDILYGNSWGQEFIFDYTVTNLYNVWTTDPFFEKVTGLADDPGWTYWQNSIGSWAQMMGPSKRVRYTQWWNDPKKAVYYDWMEIQYDYATGTVLKMWAGCLAYSPSSGWKTAVFGLGGGPVDSYGKPIAVGPVPEPSSILLLGLGLVSISSISYLKRRKI